MKSSWLKRWVVGLIFLFVFAAVLFAGTLWIQGFVADKWLDKFQRSNVIGGKVDGLTTVESSLTMKRIKFDLVWPNPRIPRLTIEGRLLLGFEPQALVWLESVNGKKYRTISDVHPQANVELSFLLEPQKARFTTASADIPLRDGTVNLGAIQADALFGKISENAGTVKIDDWNIKGMINPTTYTEKAGQMLKIGTQNFEVQLKKNSKERFSFKSNTEYLAKSEQKIEFVSLKDLGFTTTIFHDGGKITQNTNLALKAGNLLGVPFIGTIGKSNVGFSLTWPKDASPYGFMADLFTDSDFCRVFGPLCHDPEGLLGKLDTTQDELRKAALEGALSFKLNDSRLAFGDCLFTSSGLLEAQKGSSEVGHFQLGFESKDKNILRLVLGQLPMGSYIRPNENSIQMNIRINYQDRKLVITSEGIKLFEEYVSPPI